MIGWFWFRILRQKLPRKWSFVFQQQIQTHYLQNCVINEYDINRNWRLSCILHLNRVVWLNTDVTTNTNAFEVVRYYIKLYSLLISKLLKKFTIVFFDVIKVGWYYNFFRLIFSEEILQLLHSFILPFLLFRSRAQALERQLAFHWDRNPLILRLQIQKEFDDTNPSYQSICGHPFTWKRFIKLYPLPLASRN